MQLLVSVRSAGEVQPALSGGADIIDAKDPGNGSLGPVSGAVLSEIIHKTPAAVPLSIALGDLHTRAEVAEAIAAVPVRPGPAACYVKLGFAGVASPHQIRQLLEEACLAVIRHPTQPRLIAVAYADAQLAGSIVPELLCRLAADLGVSGVLLDTHAKGAGHLLTRLSLPTVAALVAGIRRTGLLAAVAGSLELEHLPLVSTARPHIVGFRRAVCTGGREGVVSQYKVRQLCREISRIHSASVRIGKSEWGLGETPEGPAKSPSAPLS